MRRIAGHGTRESQPLPFGMIGFCFRRRREEMQVNDEIHQGKVAVITGGGRGFGKAFGAALAARGAHVVLADIDLAAAQEAAAEIVANGGSASGAACDVADEVRVATMIAEVA